MHKRRKITNIVALVLVFNLSFAAMCNKEDSKTRTLARATDDFAEGQKSAANLLLNAKNSGLMSQEDVNEIKPFLIEANDLNAEAITLARDFINNPNNLTAKEGLISIINRISASLVRANNIGLVRIKNKETQVAFSAIIIAMQSAVTTAIIVLKK